MNDKNQLSRDKLLDELEYHKEFEHQLATSENKYRTLTENINVGVYRNTPGAKGKFIEVNTAFLKMFGYEDKDSILELHVSDLYETPSARENISNKLKSQGFLRDEEIRLKRKDGSIITCSFSASAVRDDNGKVLHYDGIIEDISERIKEEELREKLLETAKHLTKSLDLDTVLEQISEQALQLLNCKGITIYLLDDDGKTIHPVLSNDPPYDELVLSTPININSSLTGKVIKAKTGMIFNETESQPNSFHIPGTPETDEDHIIISPFIVANNVIGTMNLYRLDPMFSKDDLTLVNTFATYASAAIKNARTYNDLLTEMNAREKIEKKVRLSEEKYRTLTENLNVGIYRVTPGAKGDFIEINPAFLDMFGYKNKESLKDINVADFYREPTTRKKIGKKLKDQGFIKNEEIVFVKKDGKPFIGSDTAIAVKNEKGNIIYYDGIIDDITERVALRKKLVENEEKYRSVVSSSPDIIMRINNKGIINYINYMYAGEKPSEIIGKTIYDLMPSEFHEKAKQSLNMVFKTGDRFNYEHIGLSNKDNIIWYRNNVGPIVSNNKIVGATIIARDITEEKQIDIMKTEFISSVSHELRTPLAIIQESISQILDGIHGDIKKNQLDVLEPCIGDIKRLTRIIDNLLDISKIEGQKVSITRDMVDIVSLANNVLSSFKVKAEQNNLKLKFKSSVKKAELYIDHDRIIQVFMNLIGNAIKFTKKGHIELSIKKSENEIQCTISDTGMGIEHKDLATVFDRFHQVGRAINTGEKGTGLGLSISKGIIDLHNGNIWVDSEINVGSKFHFKLPIYTEDEILLENIEKGIIEATKKHIKLSLLIIRLDNFDEIRKNISLLRAKETTHKILQAFQEVIAPGEFSFIKGRNDVVLFSDITKKNIASIIKTLEKILKKFVSEFSKQSRIKMSYGYSVYPNDGNDAKGLLRSAYKTLLSKNK